MKTVHILETSKIFNSNIVTNMLCEIGYSEHLGKYSASFMAEVAKTPENVIITFLMYKKNHYNFVNLVTHTLSYSFFDKHVKDSVLTNTVKHNEDFISFSGYGLLNTNTETIYSGIAEYFVSPTKLLSITERLSLPHFALSKYKIKHNLTFGVAINENDGTIGSACIAMTEHDPEKCYAAITNLAVAFPQEQRHSPEGIETMSIYGDCFVRMTPDQMKEFKTHRSNVTRFLMTGTLTSLQKIKY